MDPILNAKEASLTEVNIIASLGFGLLISNVAIGKNTIPFPLDNSSRKSKPQTPSSQIMPPHAPTSLLRPLQSLRTPRSLLPFRSLAPRHHQTIRFTSSQSSRPPTASHRHDHSQDSSVDPLTAHRLEAEERAYYTRRTYYAGAGAFLCVFATIVLITSIELPPKPERSDAPPSSSRGLEQGNAVVAGVTGGAEVRMKGEGISLDGGKEEEEVEQVPTGTSTVPSFPKTIHLPSSSTRSTSPALPAGTGAIEHEYQLLGLGIRTVSFLSIQVYVVGLYIATPDIAALQSRLVRRVAGTETASTLVPSEKEQLKRMLLDGEMSEEVWDAVLREGGIRSVIRIVPTRNTDFAHLRDGWVRGITARSQERARRAAVAPAAPVPAPTPATALGEEITRESYDDMGFGQAIGTFKAVFAGAGRKGVDKGKVLMLERDARGVLSAWVEGKDGEGYVKLGEVADERIGRFVWLGYLAGKNVASEGARRSVVEGVMGFVERPVGTVETQVV